MWVFVVCACRFIEADLDDSQSQINLERRGSGTGPFKVCAGLSQGMAVSKREHGRDSGEYDHSDNNLVGKPIDPEWAHGW